MVLNDSTVDVACAFDLGEELGEQMTTRGKPVVFRDVWFLYPEN